MYIFGLYFVYSCLWWFYTSFKYKKVLEPTENLFLSESNQPHTGYDSEIFTSQNLKYDLEKYFKNSIL